MVPRKRTRSHLADHNRGKEFVAWFEARLVGDTRRRTLVHQSSAFEAAQVIALNKRMRPIMDHGVGHGVTARWNGFVTTRAPATVDVEAAHRGETHDGTRVRR